MTTLLHRKFKFPKGCSAESIVIRETNGIDEHEAAMQADTRAGKSSIFQELVRLAIVEVDGSPVQQPYLELERWNSKTRSLLIRAYTHLNELKEGEDEVFLLASEDVTPRLATVPKSEAEEAVDSRTDLTQPIAR